MSEKNGKSPSIKNNSFSNLISLNRMETCLCTYDLIKHNNHFSQYSIVRKVAHKKCERVNNSAHKFTLPKEYMLQFDPNQFIIKIGWMETKEKIS
jgi:hypothetical protein